MSGHLHASQDFSETGSQCHANKKNTDITSIVNKTTRLFRKYVRYRAEDVKHEL